MIVMRTGTSADFESVFVLLEELWPENNLDPDADVLADFRTS